MNIELISRDTNTNQLLSYEDLPEWYKDNNFLKKGYRKHNESIIYYIKSLFKIHNELINIYTHLIPAIVFFFLIIYSNIYNIVGNNIGDNIVLNIFLISDFICFLFSSIMHTFYPYSEKIANILSRLDYFGISLAILGFYTIFIYYAFYCHELIQIIYYIISYLLGILTIMITCFSKYSDLNDYKYIRAIIFCLFTLSILIPIFHRIFEVYDNEAKIILELKYSTLTALFVGLSLFFYISKIPERFINKNYINYIFTSHQIFHILNSTGLFLFYLGLSNIYKEHEKLHCKLFHNFIM